MNIQIISDLHREFGISDITLNESVDLYIFAGDIDTKTKGIKYLIELDKPILYVLGNHEYYGGELVKTLDKIKALSIGTKVTVLENECITIEDVTFHGCTLWSDFRLFGDYIENKIECGKVMNDYSKIRKLPRYRKIETYDTEAMFNISKKFLHNSLSQTSTDKNVIITHHAPSIKSIKEEFLNDITTNAYVSDLEDVMKKFSPDLWIHGHVHDSFDYYVNKTRVLCNPHGYITDKNGKFDNNLIITI
jgi:Icc-related predicted phosphoesterase